MLMRYMAGPEREKDLWVITMGPDHRWSLGEQTLVSHRNGLVIFWVVSLKVFTTDNSTITENYIRLLIYFILLDHQAVVGETFWNSIQGSNHSWKFIGKHQSRDYLLMRGQGNLGRVVKALDSKSNGVSPHRFESCRLRNFFQLSIHLDFVSRPRSCGMSWLNFLRWSIWFTQTWVILGAQLSDRVIGMTCNSAAGGSDYGMIWGGGVLITSNACWIDVRTKPGINMAP